MYAKQTWENSEIWEEEGKLVKALRTQGTAEWRFLGISFSLIHPKPEAKEATAWITHSSLVRIQNGPVSMEDSLAVRLQIPLDSAKCTEKTKPTGHTKICTQTWIAAPLTITKTREPPSCPPTTKWLNSWVHPHHERLLSNKKGMTGLCSNLD